MSVIHFENTGLMIQSVVIAGIRKVEVVYYYWWRVQIKQLGTEYGPGMAGTPYYDIRGFQRVCLPLGKVNMDFQSTTVELKKIVVYGFAGKPPKRNPTREPSCC